MVSVSVTISTNIGPLEVHPILGNFFGALALKHIRHNKILIKVMGDLR